LEEEYGGVEERLYKKRASESNATSKRLGYAHDGAVDPAAVQLVKEAASTVFDHLER
jgi:hypothetical protein